MNDCTPLTHPGPFLAVSFSSYPGANAEDVGAIADRGALLARIVRHAHDAVTPEEYWRFEDEALDAREVLATRHAIVYAYATVEPGRPLDLVAAKHVPILPVAPDCSDQELGHRWRQDIHRPRHSLWFECERCHVVRETHESPSDEAVDGLFLRVTYYKPAATL